MKPRPHAPGIGARQPSHVISSFWKPSRSARSATPRTMDADAKRTPRRRGDGRVGSRCIRWSAGAAPSWWRLVLFCSSVPTPNASTHERAFLLRLLLLSAALRLRFPLARPRRPDAALESSALQQYLSLIHI